MHRAYSALLGVLVIGLMGTGCATTRNRPLTWDRLPFPRDSDWAGPQGSPARVEDGDLILQGQKVRTHGIYSAPLVIDCVVELEERTAPDGWWGVEFVPVKSPRDSGPREFCRFRMIYRNPSANSGHDCLVMEESGGTSGVKQLWGEVPVTLSAGKPYAVRLEVAADHVQVTINGSVYDLKAVKVPYGQFYIQLVGWQPRNRWHVRNFSIH
ncbi:MAG TPA: hypothetical protein VL486_12165 [Verrucomicrobiae bacterium]|nr:hypothetical protein [Verrucomicrobiae bacterium]